MLGRALPLRRRALAATLAAALIGLAAVSPAPASAQPPEASGEPDPSCRKELATREETESELGADRFRTSHRLEELGEALREMVSGIGRFRIPILKGPPRGRAAPGSTYGAHNKDTGQDGDGEGQDGSGPDGGGGGELGAEGDDPPLAIFDQYPVFYFKEATYQGLRFHSGESYWQNALATPEDRELQPGVPAATLQMLNVAPRSPSLVFIPQGFRPLPESQQPEGVRIWQTGDGRVYFRSKAKGYVAIRFAKDRPKRLTHEEIRAYQTIEQPVPIEAWPEEFRQMLRSLVGYVHAHRGSLSNPQVGQLVQSFLRQFMIYTHRKDASRNAVEIVCSGRCQCDWAATLGVGILRQYFGVPARFVAGYTGTEDIRRPGKSLVMNEPDQGHAWMEVYDFRTEEWSTLDPTPSDPSRGGAPGGALGGALARLASGLSRIKPPASATGQGSGLPEDLQKMLEEWQKRLEGQSAAERLAEALPDLSGALDRLSDWLERFRREAKEAEVPPDKLAKQLRERQIVSAAIEARWAWVMRHLGSSEDLDRELRSFERSLENLSSDAAEDVAELYAGKSIDLRRRMVAAGIRYGSLEELAAQARAWPAGSTLPDRSLLAFLFLVLRETAQATRLTPGERELYHEVVRLLQVPTRSRRMTRDEREGRLLLSLLPGPVSQELLLRRYGGEDAAWDFRRMAADLRSGALDWALRAILDHRIARDLKLDDRHPTYVPRSVPEAARISDRDFEIATAEDFANFRNFVRGGLPPSWDFMRLQAGELAERRYHQDGPPEAERMAPPRTVTFIHPGVAPSPGLSLAVLDRALAESERGFHKAYVLSDRGWVELADPAEAIAWLAGDGSTEPASLQPASFDASARRQLAALVRADRPSQVNFIKIGSENAWGFGGDAGSALREILKDPLARGGIRLNHIEVRAGRDDTEELELHGFNSPVRSIQVTRERADDHLEASELGRQLRLVATTLGSESLPDAERSTLAALLERQVRWNPIVAENASWQQFARLIQRRASPRSSEEARMMALRRARSDLGEHFGNFLDALDTMTASLGERDTEHVKLLALELLARRSYGVPLPAFAWFIPEGDVSRFRYRHLP